MCSVRVRLNFWLLHWSNTNLHPWTSRTREFFKLASYPGLLYLLILPLSVAFFLTTPNQPSFWSTQPTQPIFPGSTALPVRLPLLLPASGRLPPACTSQVVAWLLPCWNGCTWQFCHLYSKFRELFHFFSCKHWKSNLGSFLYASNSFLVQSRG